jgi:transposase
MLTQEVVIMGRPRRVFTREFKQEAVKLGAAGGHPTAQVARDLGITPNLLRRWKQEVAGDPVAAFPCKGRRKPHEEDLARLKRDLARVTQERDFLKSMAAYFAKPSA